MALLKKTPIKEVASTAVKNGVWDSLDVPIKHEGRAITLPHTPEDMPLDKAIEALERKLADEEQEFNVHELFEAYPTDAAVAMVKAMNNLYGFASPQTRKTFFGPQPPAMMSVKTGWGDAEVVQVPMGEFKLPGVDAPINTTIDSGAGFVIYGTIKKKHKHIVLELATETRRILKAESIYRGKAIRLKLDGNYDVDTNKPPEFMNVSDISEANLIFDQDVQDAINVNLLTPVKYTEQCRAYNIPLKRGVLLEGPFGTGKSLTARLLANTCEQNGWTFVLLDKVQGLRGALEFAVRYAPAVVFSEDIDRVIEERDDAANDLINTIDGVVSKDKEIMVVLTTNFVEKINKVILRPGRLDAIISLRPPGPEACERLIRFYASDLLPVNAPLTNAGKANAGLIPASIRECVERAKLGMISRGDNKLADADLVTAANTMKFHMGLLQPTIEQQSAGDKLAESLKAVVNGHDTDEKVVEIDTNVTKVKNALARKGIY